MGLVPGAVTEWRSPRQEEEESRNLHHHAMTVVV